MDENNLENIDISEFNIKFCPICGTKVEKPTIRCIHCGKSFMNLKNKAHNDIQITNKNSYIATKHIDKNGLSFDYPEYYDIGNYPSSDDNHKSIVALSKRDRKCELYITVYKKNNFDNNAIRNNYLLKEYLKQDGYTNITENKKLPFCFNANKNHQMDNIKTTIVFNFKYNDVIMIVGNIIPSSNYDCIDDLKIIEKSVIYEDKFIAFGNKLIYTKDYCSGEYRISAVKLISLVFFIVFGLLGYIEFLTSSSNYDFGVIFSGLIAFVVTGLICSLPVLIIGTIIKKLNQKFKKQDIPLKDFLFYWKTSENNIRLSKTKIISWFVFFIGVLILVINNPGEINLVPIIMACIIFGLIFAIPTFLIGWVFHYLLNRK